MTEKTVTMTLSEFEEYRRISNEYEKIKNEITERLEESYSISINYWDGSRVVTNSEMIKELNEGLEIVRNSHFELQKKLDNYPKKKWYQFIKI